jgi:hypothetical protein
MASASVAGILASPSVRIRSFARLSGRLMRASPPQTLQFAPASSSMP